MEHTKVLFIKERGGNTLAIFPEIIENDRGDLACYAHIGQHSAASKDYIKGKKKASFNEWRPLYNELVTLGYTDLLVMNDIELDINLTEFVRSYLATAAWVTCETGENQDFTKEAKKQAEIDCRLFINQVISKMGYEKAQEVLSKPGSDLTYLAPHDFFLTRNGHGAGFWDREDIYGETEAKILTDISREMKGVDCLHVRGEKSKLTFF